MGSETVPVSFRNWTLLTACGLAAGLVAGLLIGIPVSAIANAMIVTATATACVGAVLGLFQALGLRRILKHPGWWVLASVVGIGVGLAAGVVLVEQIGILLTGTRPNIGRLSPAMRALSLVAVGLVAGTILGAAQALVLRRQSPRVRFWTLATALALPLAFAASSLLVDGIGLGIASAAGLILFVLVSGLAFGALTTWPWRYAG